MVASLLQSPHACLLPRAEKPFRFSAQVTKESASCVLQVTMHLKLELQAHSRLLSCMAIHPSRDIFVTAAEDATCNVWTVPLNDSDQVCTQAVHQFTFSASMSCSYPPKYVLLLLQMSVLLSVCWNNMAITGAAFTGDDDSDNCLVAAVAYDTDTLQLWRLP